MRRNHSRVQAAYAAEPAGSSVCYGFEPTEIDPDIATEPFLIVDDDPEVSRLARRGCNGT